MHVHILGICGTFMGGIAAIARAAGFKVTGSDRNVYPPMSTQLEALGITLTEGFEAAQLTPSPDVVVVGNVMTRGADRGEGVLHVVRADERPLDRSPRSLTLEHLEAREIGRAGQRLRAPQRLGVRRTRETLERRPAAHR